MLSSFGEPTGRQLCTFTIIGPSNQNSRTAGSVPRERKETSILLDYWFPVYIPLTRSPLKEAWNNTALFMEVVLHPHGRN
ncbi:hypothetical protein M419DRAFT_122950 [Trichoderma reesei RUT C-30]|uniref:Uncharacterized protein n=1 Tax=Hypocrea jecorina (strain ATCC 56765 / BCRC 32924 / NRRL 11460 / Rut C-30) TaxID=1344414 RepID=A0A024SF11_HYPJR|nr:hypothetical protein M419DRAFT_122950 [Trichoderma reesei RUT C-30]